MDAKDTKPANDVSKDDDSESKDIATSSDDKHAAKHVIEGTEEDEAKRKSKGAEEIRVASSSKLEEPKMTKKDKDEDASVPSLQKLVDRFENCEFSKHWFEGSELYEELKGSTLIVNNSNQHVDFGGGGTNGAIRDYFWRELKYFMWIFPRGGQPWHKWNSLAGGLFDYEAVKAGRFERTLFSGTSWKDTPDVEDGTVLYSPLPKERRRNTNVIGILQAVGPRNTVSGKAYRTKCAGIVADITRRCLDFAHALNVKNIVMAGISTGIFANWDRKFAAAMRGAMLRVIRSYFKSRPVASQVRVTIIGRNWDEVL